MLAERYDRGEELWHEDDPSTKKGDGSESIWDSAICDDDPLFGCDIDIGDWKPDELSFPEDLIL